MSVSMAAHSQDMSEWFPKKTEIYFLIQKTKLLPPQIVQTWAYQPSQMEVREAWGSRTGKAILGVGVYECEIGNKKILEHSLKGLD